MCDKETDMLGKELYHRYLAGDETALRELIRIYQEPLIAFICKYTGDMHDARELALDAFTGLALSNKRFRGDSSLKTYLFGIGRNLALYHLKKRKYHAPLMDTEPLIEDGHPSLEEDLMRKERALQLDAVMQELKPAHYTVLRLLYYENMSYAQAGRVMKKTEAQIGSLAYRARISLRKKLEREGLAHE